ncbi:MAG: prepilin-type N-terminal cleavage/methylation domain-containing protein, partial [Gammaproteobacteria bacterium]|nr:prepilin-type N-terminal cleavage/methylation domain-containing protein [Gammaproteobacteria bacterium]
MRYSNFNRRSACLGFSLIELLLALAISVTALLG